MSLVYYQSPDLGKYWKQYFKNDKDVEIIEGDIFELKTDAIVSPGNSFGFMDGGLDLLITRRMGWQIQTQLRKFIKSTEMGELLVGQAHSVESENGVVICAPTMRVPSSAGIPNSINAYLAMKALLIEGLKNKKVKSIAIPGLCTGTGKMPAKQAAKQMKAAYDEVIHDKIPEFPLFMDALKFHKNLIRE